MSPPQTVQNDPRYGQTGAVLMLIGGISSFQIGAALAKGLFPVFGPEGMVGLRVGLAATILMMIWRPTRAQLTPRVLKLLIPYGASVAIMNFCFYVALTRLPLGMTVALEFMGPLSLALSGSRRWLDLLWVVLVVGGLFFLLRPEHALGPLDPIGVGAALFSGVGWVIYILTGTRIGKVLSPVTATSLGLATAAFFLLPWLIPALPVAVSHPEEGVLALCVAILSSAVPYILDMLAMRRLKPRDLGILLSMEPMLGAVSGLLLLHETLSVSRWIGVGCIVLASAGNVLTSRTTTPIETQPPPG
ncbi:EamA family transporter [Brytella acorum]|uniref:EamA family transporter n=1 Tax=Brytella acorum TaxID=2959299 RepID=A0AA35UV01_9PROT|nr:EamA family transporter [Brytella acorum]MDF3623658.1 EamA family transporter [Brytella acorum]CAI9119924.1 EamA family transporter [Brytella acorum]